MNERKAQPAPSPGIVDLGSVVVLLYVLSGATALTYQMVYLRAFVELYGSTTAALGAAVGAFLSCLALGAAIGGRIADRLRRPLVGYAVLEAMAAVGGAISVLALARLDGYATELAVRVIDGESVTFSRALASLGVMLVPVSAMGATLPVLARFRAMDRGRGLAAGALQFANTFGAVAGVLLSAWVLLPEFGLSRTLWIAAGANAALALGSGLLGLRSAAVPSKAPARPTTSEGTGSRVSPWPFLFAAAVSGFLLIALEVLFFRGVSQMARGSLDSAAMLLSVVLLANALGTVLGMFLARSEAGARTGFVLGQLLTAAGVFFGLGALYRLDPPVWEIFAASQNATSLLHRAVFEGASTLVVAGPAAFFAGIVFPCVCHLRPRGFEGFGSWVGAQSATWTLGAAAAGMGGASSLLVHVGLRESLLLCTALPLLALGAVLVVERQKILRERMLPLALGSAVLLGVALTPAGDASPWSDPLRFYRAGLEPEAALLQIDEERPAYFEDHLANVAVVVRPTGEKVLKVDNLQSLGGSGASKVEVMQGLLPSLLHEDPRRALTLGVGAGITVGGLVHSGVAHVDAVELVPAVLDCLPFFAYENGSVQVMLTDGSRQTLPNVELHHEDARTFVRGAEAESYDLIIGDLFFPWQSEAGFLYTREHFERVRRLLAPGGLFCQWLPAHQLRWEEIGIIGRTFSEVFDGTTMWLAQPDAAIPVVGLIAGKESLKLDVETIRKRVEEHPAPALLEGNGVADYRKLLSLYLCDEFLFRNPRVFESEEINTGDRPVVEFRSSRRMELDHVVGLNNRQTLMRYKEDVVGRMSAATLDRKERGPLQQELAALSRSLTASYEGLTYALLASENEAMPAGQRNNDPGALRMAAIGKLSRALQETPQDPWVLAHLAGLLEFQAQRGFSSDVVRVISALFENPAIGRPIPLLYLRGKALLEAACQMDEGDPRDALELCAKDLGEVLAAQPENVRAEVHRGVALFLVERDRDALAALEHAKELLPEQLGVAEIERFPAVLEAILYYLRGQREEARNLIDSAAAQYPYRDAVAARIAG